MNSSAPASAISRWVVLGLVAIVLLAPTQYGIKVGKNHLSLVDPVVWATFAAWLFSLVKTGGWRTLRVNLVFPVLFVLLAALSLIRAPNLLRSGFKLLQHAEYFIAAYLLFITALADRKVFRLLLAVFLGVSALAVLAGVVHYATPAMAPFQVRSFFGNSSVFGGFLALALPLIFGLALMVDNVRWRIGLLAVVLAGVAVTLSGGTFLALALAFAGLAMARGWKGFVATAAVLLAVVFLVLPHLPRHNPDALRESIAFFDDDGQFARRYAEWQAAVEMTREHPLLGVGSGCYQERIGEFYGIIPVVPGSAAQADSQNLYLVLAASVGLPGLAAFLGLLLYALRQAVLGLVRETDLLRKGVYLGAAGSIAAFMINSLWSPLLVRGIGIPLVLILAFAAARPRAEDRV